eukprot:TRINITY_DN12475_c0_g3_i1.p1 TRINITY_DN12475_c0_g3~~TRINITY_DN12475_c0_g3_i1.p1  ORF type:complete len:128 (-),score=26.52 TRINITY_DN12475_c0_g3_i1:440-823(-)
MADEDEPQVVDTTLRPKLLHIGQRQYRTTFPDDGIPLAGDDGEVATDLQGDDSDYDLMDDGRYKFVMTIPPMFYGNIIGKGGKTLRQLEADTQTSIKVKDCEAGQSSSQGVILVRFFTPTLALDTAT